MIDLPYREVWAVDFEFAAPSGERPEPACLVAMELRSGRRIRLWRDQFGDRPPYPVDANSLFVAYFASAEMGCHRALGWPMPARVLDLFTEFRDMTNGHKGLDGEYQKASLLDALCYFNLNHIDAAAKDEMRGKFIAGAFDSWSPEERESGLDYCETDVVALANLLPAMLPTLDMRHALIRGRYSGPAVSAMEHEGVPIDVPAFQFVRDNWEGIIDELIARIDTGYGIYDGRTFKEARFEAYLAERRIPWGRTAHGHLKLDDDTFADMAKIFPALEPLRNLRHSLGGLRLNDLNVGQDGRNRAMLRQFASRTGRNQPSSSKFIFGPGVWLRGFIAPPRGCALAYIDWKAAEFGIAAKLSEDPAMMAAYETGDPHLAFAKKAGAVPDDATKDLHEAQRDRYKSCNFGILYGMGLSALAKRIGADTNDPEVLAAELFAAHRRLYRRFWEWAELNEDHATLYGGLQTMFGWHVHTSCGSSHNPRSMRNFPVQAGCAEIMRIAACLATERDVPVCAPVHDAFLVCSPIDRVENDVQGMRAAMAEASRVALGGFELQTDVKRVAYPNHYMDKRGVVMWDTVMGILETRYARRILWS